MVRHTISRMLVCDCWVPVSMFFICLLLPLDLQSATTKAERDKPDERKLALAVVDTLVKAWNKNDTETIGKLFLRDAVLVLPTGSVIRSQSAIRKRIMDERRGRLKDTVLHHTVGDVSLDSANTAVVKGKYQLEGMKLLGITSSPEGSFVLRQRKQGGRWMISRAELTRNNAE
jgi:uncharacterized protein (TIGR02246 family)